jgi:hypothetical protein
MGLIRLGGFLDFVPFPSSRKDVIPPKMSGPEYEEDNTWKKTFSEEQIALALQQAEMG